RKPVRLYVQLPGPARPACGSWRIPLVTAVGPRSVAPVPTPAASSQRCRLPRRCPSARRRTLPPRRPRRLPTRARFPRPAVSLLLRIPDVVRRSRDRPCVDPEPRPVPRRGFPRHHPVRSLALVLAGLARVVLVDDLGIHHVVAFRGGGSGAGVGRDRKSGV